MVKARRESVARQNAISWETDRISSDNLSSQEVLMAWLLTPGNADRWRREKRTKLMEELFQLLEANGINHRSIDEIRSKIMRMENSFKSASAHLLQNGQWEAFKRGDATSNIVEHVLMLCPQYRELQPVFGKDGARKKKQVKSQSGAASAASESVAGAAKTAVESTLSAVVNRANTLKMINAIDGGSKMGGKKIQEVHERVRARTNGIGGEEKNLYGADTTTIMEKSKPNVSNAKKSVHVGDAEMINDAIDSNKGISRSQDDNSIAQSVENGDDGILVDDINTLGKSRSDFGKVEECIVNQAEAEANGLRAKENAFKRVDVRYGAKNSIQMKAHPTECDQSSVDEEDSDKTEDGNSEQVDVDDAEYSDQSEAVEKEVEKLDSSEETDEEVEEEEPTQSTKTAADSTDDNSSTSESQYAEPEDEISLNQFKPKYEHDVNNVESEYDVESDEDESDNENNGEKDMEELSAQSESSIEADSSHQTQKRSKISVAHHSNRPSKHARTEKRTSKATMDLERLAFIEHAKQERDQREKLFELERAKLECELQSKQVQLSFERSLARKKLLSAGVDPDEVNRVLPLS
ncbi:uncharacterized protein PHALS_01988 [Plasmopara halstedii]|uniref:Uncharacterized protein n=1 Tax=Plasmopara halstedii TaxID=4781 RepID=A0A0N7L702_PLAHL|nr:uncharacterized protein PHALS_01988 [Plasmopara halstedii]CEG45707.1 hypothetical protein PHALS_01988 [Plasmopara halstedii]|eukprot:XP_024582076.1 hypothetical protein PHALS_01988 [Plasmopara halstedii]